MLLYQGALNGDAYLECARASSHPRAASVLLSVFQIGVALLLVNMLIAMMAKTFDHVWEAQELNYQVRRNLPHACRIATSDLPCMHSLAVHACHAFL